MGTLPVPAPSPHGHLGNDPSIGIFRPDRVGVLWVFLPSLVIDSYSFERGRTIIKPRELGVSIIKLKE